jgi:hemolysin type calcium-binding protein
MTTSRRIAILTTTLALAAPAAAPAATLEHTAGTGPANEEFLVYTAGKGERNRLVVTSSKHAIVFVDRGARIHRKKHDFGGCKFSRSGHRATCAIEGYTDLVVHLGKGNDSLRFAGSNGGRTGKTPRTNVKDAARLSDRYDDLEGGNYEHAIVTGGEGNDTIAGTDQDDFLNGGQGKDRVDGGGGPDRILDHPDGAADTLLGGTGVDTVDGDGGVPLTIDLGAAKFRTSDGENDSLDSFEEARGGFGNDTLIGTDGPDGLFGDNGDDSVDGLGGNDYLGADLSTPQYGQPGGPGVDTLTGGPGDDVLDGRDQDRLTATTPTDQLICGEGSDRIVARQDDLADPSCESSAFGTFTGDLYFEQEVDYKALSGVTPVARGDDGAPTYEIACAVGFTDQPSCKGHVQLELPPVTGKEKQPTILGASADFTIPKNTKANVQVVLNDAGKAALAQPGARASVHVITDRADFGWQQVLGP